MAEPTYYTGILASVAGANKHHLTLWNVAGSGKTLKLRKITVAGAPTVAVTGLVIALYAARITTQPTGGTVPVIRKAVAADAALPAGIEVKAAPTGGASPEAEPFGVAKVSGEETAAPGAQNLYEYTVTGAKPIEVAQGQGITIRQGALASAGAINVTVLFTAV
jgi:hypothetical protein